MHAPTRSDHWINAHSWKFAALAIPLPTLATVLAVLVLGQHLMPVDAVTGTFCMFVLVWAAGTWGARRRIRFGPRRRAEAR